MGAELASLKFLSDKAPAFARVSRAHMRWVSTVPGGQTAHPQPEPRAPEARTCCPAVSARQPWPPQVNAWHEVRAGLLPQALMMPWCPFHLCSLQPTGKMLVEPLVYTQRLELMRNVCREDALRNLSHTAVSKFVLDRIFVCDKHKILFCQTPKVGNTQWKKVLIVLNGVCPSCPDLGICREGLEGLGPAARETWEGWQLTDSSLVLFLFLATLCGTWDLNSLTRPRTRAPCSGSEESQPPDHPGILWCFSCSRLTLGIGRVHPGHSHPAPGPSLSSISACRTCLPG